MTDPTNDNQAAQLSDQQAQQQTARASYDRMSKVYAWLSDDSEKRFVDLAIDGLLKPQPGEAVLEPGFGTGQVLAALAQAVGPDGKAFGIDISDGMLHQASKLLAEHGLEQQSVLQVASATDMPFAENTFDAVFMSFTLELFPDDQIPLVLAECARVLKPTGRLCVAAMSDKGGNAAMEALYRWSHAHFPKFVDCRPISVRPTITKAGFTIEDGRAESMWGLAVDIVLARPPQSRATATTSRDRGVGQ